MERRIAVGGCREYNDYGAFCEFVDLCLSEIKDHHRIIILSGHCSGVDRMGERYAKSHHFGLEIFPADWEKHGRAAGLIRNKQLVERSDLVIAFWDYRSRGIKSLIDHAKARKKDIFIKDISEK